MKRPPDDGTRSPTHTSAEKQAVKTTIVGGQPTGTNRSLPPIPVGLEQVMAMASVNGEFAVALYVDRNAAIAASGVELTKTERGILGAIDNPTLRRMVTNIGGGVPDRQRRAFLTRSAAALLVLAGGALPSSACGDDKASAPSAGPEPSPTPAPASAVDDASPSESPPPESPPPQSQPPDAAVPPDASTVSPKPAGIRPDRPGASRGIRPDRPGSGDVGGSKHPNTTTGVRPDRPEKQPTRGIRPDRPADIEPNDPE